MKQTIITKNEKETIKLGEDLASKLKPGDLVLLTGELGSGKTTFVKGLAYGLKAPSRIISPTFVVVRTHKTDRNAIKKIYHLDLYRLQSEEDIKAIALEDFLLDEEAVVLIEWPEKSISLIKKPAYKISFKNLEDDRREISIVYD